MSDSSWEQTRARSQYHFQPGVFDPRWDTVIRLGQFQGEWQQELVEAIELSQPTTWATRAPNGTPADVLATEEYDLERYGYGADYVVTDLTWTIAPVFQRMADCFAMEDPMVRVHVQWPGQCWNLHIDKLDKWCPEDPGRVGRYFIALTAWEMGHFWNYGNYIHAGWAAGDITTFDWQNVPHSTANAGHNPRVTLQVTGVKTPDTEKFLETLRDQYFVML